MTERQLRARFPRRGPLPAVIVPPVPPVVVVPPPVPGWTIEEDRALTNANAVIVEQMRRLRELKW